MKQKITFKDGFLWGSAMSAYQTEGGNDNTDWWVWEHSDKRIATLKKAGKDSVDYQSGIACDVYNRFDADFALAEKLNHNTIRISIEWARIEPTEGEFSEEALAHYESVLRSAKAHGLTTFVTLHHFTLPLWFAHKGGFLRRNNNENFIAYVKIAAQRLHPLVDFWITINEPEIYATHSYLLGKFPPHIQNVWKSFTVVRNLIQAHNEASIALHSISDTPVGMANQLADIQAASVFSRSIAVLARFLSTRYVLNRVVEHCDFIGLNYYLRQNIGWGGLYHKKYEKYDASDLGWELYPNGIENILNDLRSYDKPIYVTENGLADAKDTYREKFIKDHLFHIHKAIENGADVRGYLHWSLIDNFEWADGFSPRFGLVEIDRKNSLRRNLRPSALAYAEICKSNTMEYEI